MGWTVLYIAFGVVALWLLGEVLLQYKARLRWRVLAFTGFLCVVAGALIPSVLVIGIGIAAFATGQTFVTLSYRRGFVAGWALTGVPGFRRREEAEPEPEPAPGTAPEPVEAPEPVPALTGSGGYGPDAFQQNGQNGAEPDGFDTAAFPALDSMSAPPGFNGRKSFETGGMPAAEPMGAPSGYAPNGRSNGNRYDNAEGFTSDGFAPDAFGTNGNGYDTAAFAGAGMNGMNGGPNGAGPDGFDAAQAFQPFSPESEGYQTGAFSSPGRYGGPQDTGQVPVYQPGPMPDETGEFMPGGYGGYGYPSPAQQPGIYQDQGGRPYGQFPDPYAAFDAGGAAQPGGPSYDTYGGGYGGYETPYGGYDPMGGFGGQQGYGPQQSPYGVSDTYGGGGGLGAGGSGADAYGSMYGNGETYADGQSYFPQAPTGAAAWVPQQRDPNEPMQQEQYPYQDSDPYGYGPQGQGNGYYGAGNGYYY